MAISPPKGSDETIVEEAFRVVNPRDPFSLIYLALEFPLLPGPEGRRSMDVDADQANSGRGLPDDRFSVVVVLVKGDILPADPDRRRLPRDHPK